MTNTIAFPGLGIGAFTLSTGFSFFGYYIHWYGIIIALGVTLGYLYAKKKATQRSLDKEVMLDVVLWGLPAAVICARIYYVIFAWEDYRESWTDIFKIWEGGIAIYGAVIGASIAAVTYCRVKKIPVAGVLDAGAFGLLIGQMIGRWGNFVNAEAYGSATDTALLRMELVNQGITVHPAFFYESMWNLLVFIFINWYERHQKFDGEMFLVYLTGYGLGRFFIEGIRADSLWLGPIRISQLVAALCVIGGVAAILWLRYKNKKVLQ